MKQIRFSFVCRLFVMIAILAGSISNVMAREVSVSYGTQGSSYPYLCNTKYSTCQFLYTPAELNGDGKITSISFYVNSVRSTSTSSVKIYMGVKNSTSYSTSSGYNSSSNLKLVYSGAPTLMSKTGWEKITLQTPFGYNGEDNLIVVVCKSLSYTNEYYYYSCASGQTTTLWRGGDYSEYSNVANTSYSYTVCNDRPYTKFEFETPGPDDRSNVIASNTAGATVSFSTNNDYEWEYSSYGYMESTNQDEHNATSETTMKINLQKPAEFSFDYSVSSEENYDKLTIQLDGSTIVNDISGNQENSYRCDLAAGSHTLIMRYTKDSSVSKNNDCARISNVRFVDNSISVSSISLNQTSASMKVGDTVPLVATISPSNATNKTYTWSSSNAAVATVSSAGVVTAVGLGTANIVATANDGSGAKATCMVTVRGASIASGTSGTCKWEIYDDGELVISPTTGPTGTLGDWGTGNEPWYSNRTKIKKASFTGTIYATTCYNMFYYCQYLTSVDLSNLNTSNVTDMRYMFYSCKALTSLDVRGLKTDNVTRMDGMFSDCQTLAVINGLYFNTSNVTSMASMFSMCYALNNLYLDWFDTSKVTDMSNMFNQCKGLEHIDLSNFNTGNVTTMYYMFGLCTSLTSIDVSSFNTSKVTNMSYMFSQCSGLTSLDVSMFDTKMALNMYNMFGYCSSLTSLNLTGITNTRNNTVQTGMFTQCNNLQTIYSDNETPSTLLSNTFNFLPTLETCRLIVPRGAKAAYMAANGWSTLKNISEVSTPVTSITLNTTSSSLLKGQTLQLSATATPNDADDKTVTWTSNNTSVATVDETGRVTAAGTGTATITATANDGSEVTATCTVTVTNPITSISLNRTSLSLVTNATSTLSVTYNPVDADNRSVTWTSNNTAVATVSSGLITAKASGTATITARTPNGKTATCTVTVTQPVTGITLSKTSVSIVRGSNLTLTATIVPSNASNKSVTWTSSNTSVATVSTTGVVTAVAAGTATITATAKDGSGKTATCTVTVTQPVTGITLSKTSTTIVRGSTETLSATITPSNATNKSVTWTSNNTSVATVSSNGLVTAVSEGTATITATANDGSGVKATCMVTVQKLTCNILDSETTFTNATEIQYDELTYTRNFKNKTLQALFVPFAMSYDDWKDNFTVYAIDNVTAYDSDDDEVLDALYLYIDKITNGRLKPNHPYLIKANNPGEQTITVNNATLYRSEDKDVVDCMTTRTRFTFQGIYAPTAIGTSSYAFSGGSLKRPKDESVQLGAFRWYMTVEDRGSQWDVPALNPAEVKVMIIGEDEEEETTMAEIAGMQHTPKVYYSPSGTRSITPQKGINIVRMSDGSTRKVTIK